MERLLIVLQRTFFFGYHCSGGDPDDFMCESDEAVGCREDSAYLRGV